MVADNRCKLKLITVSIQWNTCLLVRQRVIPAVHLGLKDKVQGKMEHLTGKKSNILLWHRLKTESNLSQMQLASPSPQSHLLRDPQRGNAEATGGKRLSAFGENAEQHRKKEFHQPRIKESMWRKGGRLKDWEKNRRKMRDADFCQSCSCNEGEADCQVAETFIRATVHVHLYSNRVLGQPFFFSLSQTFLQVNQLFNLLNGTIFSS